MALTLGLETLAVTITSGTSLSAAVPTGAKTICGIAMPAGWDAAAMTFQASVDGGTTWLELYDITGAAVSVVLAASQYIEIDPVIFCGINMLKIRSGTSGSAVNQTADRIVTLIMRPF